MAATMAGVRVAVIDVGANTLRLLVVEGAPGGLLETVREERVQLGLGEEIELTGRISRRKLRAVTETARRQLRRARKLGSRSVDVLVTSPGRQSENSAELLAALQQAGAARVRVLTAEEEACLAWAGAVAAATDLPEPVAVCDVGGGSTQIVVGTRTGGPTWARSFDVGSLRLTHRLLAEDPPPAKAVAAARAQAARELPAGVTPIPGAGLATGGTARALKRIVGRSLGHEALELAVFTLVGRTRREIAVKHGVDRARANTLLAGTIILSEVQRRLEVPLEVARGGIREGAASALLAAHAAVSA
jgi:exopolyphosphatase / guanosine-5'-triphosphate,3'-diphosphate pyrophosphatase